MLKKILPLFLIFAILSGCGRASNKDKISIPETEKFSSTVYAMDTVMDISLYGGSESVLKDVESLILDLESKLSTTDEESEIYKLNNNKIGELSEDTADILNKALGFCEKTQGNLDISIYPVVREWGFTTGEYNVPSEENIISLLKNVDYSQLAFDKSNNTVNLPENMKIDLGSVAKGYTGDRVLELLKEEGVVSALLNLGGNVQTLGIKPNGEKWNIGIQDPLSEGYIGALSVSDSAVITSGGYERFFEDEKGNIYWHIIDPKTGHPARNGIISATAIGPKGAYCDALSTSLFIMGKENAIEFWREYKDFEMILVTDTYEVFITPSLAEDFVFNEDSIYTLKVISNDQN